jgi:prepilin-type N-terminal cleavage/methylation domain-containing protein
MNIDNLKLKVLQFNNRKGFSLVEVLVVITVLAIIFIIIMLGFDPTRNLKKARDAQRKHDLEQLRNALDTYYNDNNCYPENLDQLVPTYIKRVPIDPLCESHGYCYVYLINSDQDCPQWAAVFAHLELGPSIEDTGENSCPVIAACGFPGSGAGGLPEYNADLNFCIFLGDLDCSIVGNSALYPTGYGFMPTTTPIPCTPERQQYACLFRRGEWRCNEVQSAANNGPGVYCTANCDGACGNM